MEAGPAAKRRRVAGEAPAAAASQLPPLSADQEAAVALAARGRNVCILGKAGVGKTRTLLEVVDRLGGARRVAVVAFCGSAAHAAGGVTINNFLDLRVCESREAVDAARKRLEDRARKARSFPPRATDKPWQREARERAVRVAALKTLVLDELSMTPPYMFELLDAYLRAARACARPFGGVQLVLVGDPCQLPPVPLPGEALQYVFDTPLWARCNFSYSVLSTVLRQSDLLFVRVLDAVRAGQRRPFRDWEPELREALLARVDAPVLDSGGRAFEVVRLSATNAAVDRANCAGLAALPGAARSYPVRVAPEEVAAAANADLLGNARPVELKPGARVTLTHNLDVARGLFNGAVGVVQSVSEDQAVVRFRGGAQTVPRVEVERQLAGGAAAALAAINFMPLRVAYGMTLHRCQGATLDAAEVNLSAQMPANAAYVGLSRTRDLGSTCIRVPAGHDPAAVLEAAFRTDERALAFLDRVQLAVSAAPP